MSTISGADCFVLGKFPKAPKRSWVEVLTPDDRAAFVRVHRALKEIVDDAASRHAGLIATTTSGFYEASGIRNQRPKDLWAALSNENSSDVVGMPQIFMIASGRGVELGFAAAIHRGQFSAAPVKAKLKEVVPALFSALPGPSSEIASQSGVKLTASGGWHFRGKTRMTPFENDYASVAELLTDLHSHGGKQRGAAAISRYFLPTDLDGGQVDLKEQFEEAIHLFTPLMKYVRSRQGAISASIDGFDAIPVPLQVSSESYLVEFSKEDSLDSEVARMARSIIKTVNWSNGQTVAATLKDKTTSFAARLQIQQFLKALWERQAGHCALTGAPLSMESANPWLRVSCDRIDSDKGYEPENMQLTLWAANRLKGSASMQEWERIKAALRVMGLAIEQQESKKSL